MANGVSNRPRKIAAGISIPVNFMLSWTILPLAIPPFRGYSLREMGEVLLWQSMGMVGWPLGLVGGLTNLVLHHSGTDLVNLLLLSMYPVMILFLVLSLFPRRPRWWALASLHIVLTGSFVAVWHKVLNGYDFMKG
ncbi:MAG TPA: hypothetical protein VMH22_04495 [bacterium]|nr:hypothetical protein [bacterium]